MKMKQIVGLDCVELSNGAVDLLVPSGVGPRILSLRANGGDNLLAELPDFTVDWPGGEPPKLWGGHRLWHAPEVPLRTYWPDDQAVDIAITPTSLTVTQQADASQIEKSIEIALPDESATIVIDHVLTNRSMWPIECAAWPITQLRPGGTAILPQNTAFVDATGHQANRPISLWPYTDINSPHVQWGNRYIFFDATIVDDESFKIGFPNPVGWLGYWIDGQLFVKSAEYIPTARYYDNQSSSECYCNADFIELETLGPITTVAPGERIVHREVWRVFDVPTFEPNEDAVADLVQSLNL